MALDARICWDWFAHFATLLSFSALSLPHYPGRVARLRQAQDEAEKTIRELRAANQASFQAELAAKDQGDAGFAADLTKKVESEKSGIEAGYQANKNEVIDLLLRHVTTVELEVSEALRQALITKFETGTH